MEIINLHKRCNKKARKTLRSKKVTEPGLDDSAIEEEQKWSSDEKKSVTKAGKKVKKISQSKKAPKSPEFIDSSGDEQEGPPKDNKESPLLGVKEEAQSCFDLRKDTKNLTIEKEVERVVFMRGPYKGQEWSNVALCDTEYLKKALKRSDLDKKIKDLIKQALAKTLLFLTFFINHTPISPVAKTIRVHVCSATNPTAFPRKRKHQQHFSQ